MNVLIYGGGLLGRQVYYLTQAYLGDRINVQGFVDDFLQKGSEVVDGLTVVGSFADISSDDALSNHNVELIFAIGYNDMPARHKAYLCAKKKGYTFKTIVHPSAVVEKNVHLGEGCIVLAGVILDQYVQVGPVNYFDIGTLVGENTSVGENNYFSAGCTVGGSVSIGTSNFFGLNTTVTNDIGVGDLNFVNAKTLIYKNIGTNYQIIELHQSRSMKRK